MCDGMEVKAATRSAAAEIVMGTGAINRRRVFAATRLDLRSAHWLAHDAITNVTYVWERTHQWVRRLYGDTGKTDIFCMMRNVRCMALVPVSYRSVEMHLVCCVAGAVYVVGNENVTGTGGNAVRLLAGDRCRRTTRVDDSGSLARFHEIVACAFDAEDQLVVIDLADHGRPLLRTIKMRDNVTLCVSEYKGAIGTVHTLPLHFPKLLVGSCVRDCMLVKNKTEKNAFYIADIHTLWKADVATRVVAKADEIMNVVTHTRATTRSQSIHRPYRVASTTHHTFVCYDEAVWVLPNTTRVATTTTSIYATETAPISRLLVDFHDPTFRISRAGVPVRLDVICVNAVMLEADGTETILLLTLLKSLTENGMARWPPGILEVMAEYTIAECCLLVSVNCASSAACVVRISTGIFDVPHHPTT